MDVNVSVNIDVVPLRPDHAEPLWTIYLDHVASAPHSRFLPDLARFCDELLGRITRPISLFDVPRQSQTFVAEVAGVVQGFVTLVTYPDGDAGDHQAITSLFFTTEAAGDALIRTCEAQATADELRAFPAAHGNTPIHSYNVGWDGLSDRVPRVARRLTKHGFVPYFRELHLIAHLQPSQPITGSSPAGLSITFEGPTEANGELLVRAMDGEKKVGVCSYSTLASVTAAPEASRIGYIWWMHVNEEYRRRGIARTLMLAAREQMVKQGCNACWLTTTADNWRAQSLYYSLDFDMVDCSVSFRKMRGVQMGGV